MLLILIPAVWLSVAMFVVLLCRAAADADSVLLASTERASSHTALGVSDTALGVSGSQRRAARTWRRVDARERAGAASRAAAGRPRRTPVGR
jgi:hypothetical protein